MKKYLVIGNPIDHSLSPQLHNYWIKNNNIDAIYEREKLENDDLENLVLKVKNKKINGVNVTVPFKKEVIPYLDMLSPEAKATKSVNTIYLKGNNTIGHNTDIGGFEFAIKDTKYDLSGKKVLILGAGGVVPSLIFALKKMKVFEIILSNRTRAKAEDISNLFNDISIVDWGEIPNFDMIINATSLGLNNKDEFNFDFSKLKKDKFFYDVIYNPKDTNFLKIARKFGNKTENGKKMFIYQAAEAFKIWHGIDPKIDKAIYELLNK
ncbi:shikimate dehydrogenase [Candidatus Pelagibacter sp.]|jgi:shikimate dehydrogenase|nr:shikimate dehydrogenase [Candidatus Pelagibacter sp.]